VSHRATVSGSGPRARPPWKRSPPAPRLLIVAVGAAFVLRLAACLFPASWAWGLDTLRHWPLAPAVTVAALGLLGLVPPVARVLDRALDRAGSLLERGGRAADLAIAAALGVALFTLRDPVRFTGDFYTRYSQLLLTAQTERIFPQSAPLDRWVNIEGSRALMRTGLGPVESLQAVGAVMGALFGWATLAFLRARGASRGMLAACGLLVLGAGYMPHFAGYDKFGPLLLGLAIAAYGSARLQRDGCGAWALGLGVAMAILGHRSGLALLPAALGVAALAWRAAPDRRGRIELAVAVLVVLAAAAAAMPKAASMLLAADRDYHLPGAQLGSARAAPSLVREIGSRIGNALNLLFMLAPLWPAGLAAAWMVVRRRPAGAVGGSTVDAARFSLAGPAVLLLLSQLVILFVVKGGQGVMRDWDIHSATGAAITLFSAGALTAATRRSGTGGLVPALATAALATSLSAWGLHANKGIQLRRADSILARGGSWSDGALSRAHDLLGILALREGDTDRAKRHLESAIAAAPNPRYFFELGLTYRRAGQPTEARARFEQAARLDPLLPDAWVGFALLAWDKREWAEAAAAADSALARGPYRSDAKAIREEAMKMAGATE